MNSGKLTHLDYECHLIQISSGRKNPESVDKISPWVCDLNAHIGGLESRRSKKTEKILAREEVRRRATRNIVNRGSALCQIPLLLKDSHEKIQQLRVRILGKPHQKRHPQAQDDRRPSWACRRRGPSTEKHRSFSQEISAILSCSFIFSISIWIYLNILYPLL